MSEHEHWICDEAIRRLQFDAQGLIPAVVQDFATGEVLTVAYMNQESLAISLREQHTCFFSRSRNTLWRKGETSGHVQRIVRITADCDYDALVVQVIKSGPACHLNRESCFHNPLFNAAKDAGCKDGALDAKDDTPSAPLSFSVGALYALLCARKAERPEGSYTTYLFEKGLEKILKKVGEECTEVVIAAMKRNKEETIYEAADLYYHMLVLLCEMGVSPDDVAAELARRHVIDHKIKQEPMV